MLSNDLLHPGQSRSTLPAPCGRRASDSESESDSARAPDSDSDCGLQPPEFAESASDRLLALPTCGCLSCGMRGSFLVYPFFGLFIAAGFWRAVTGLTVRYDSEESNGEEEGEQ